MSARSSAATITPPATWRSCAGVSWPCRRSRSNTARTCTTRYASALLRITTSSTSGTALGTLDLTEQTGSLHGQLDVHEAWARTAAGAHAPEQHSLPGV